jgi:hypothetical protein
MGLDISQLEAVFESRMHDLGDALLAVTYPDIILPTTSGCHSITQQQQQQPQQHQQQQQQQQQPLQAATAFSHEPWLQLQRAISVQTPISQILSLRFQLYLLFAALSQVIDSRSLTIIRLA